MGSRAVCGRRRLCRADADGRASLACLQAYSGRVSGDSGGFLQSTDQKINNHEKRKLDGEYIYHQMNLKEAYHNQGENQFKQIDNDIGQMVNENTGYLVTVGSDSYQNLAGWTKYQDSRENTEI